MTSKPTNMALGRRGRRLWSRFKGLFRKPPAPAITLAPRFEQLEEAIRSLRVEISSQLSFHTYDLAEELQGHLDKTRSALDEVHAKLDTAAALPGDMQSRLQALGNASFELTNRVIGIDTGVNSRLNAAETKLFELGNQLATTTSELKSRFNEIEAAVVNAAASPGAANAIGQLANTLTNMRNELQALAGQAVNASIDGANRLATVQGALMTRLNELETRSFEATNQVIHQQSEAQSRLGEISSLSLELRNVLSHVDSNLNSRLNDVLYVQLPSVLEQIHEACALELAAMEQRRPGDPSRSARPSPTRGDNFEAILGRAKQDFPTVYSQWRERLDTMGAAFDVTKVGNAANAGDPYSRLFRSFVGRYIRGPVLDVGCGPFGRPYYLNSYPAALISGLEPLPFPPNDEIQILRGISEYLPWQDGAFDTVISGTSLDHALSLDKSLDEMIRVLAPDGVCLLWLGHNPGSPPFRPLDPDFKPADQFHLFHFDLTWFEPLLEKRFEVIERVKLDKAGYSHVFYALRPIPGSPPYDQTGGQAGAAKTTGATGKGRKVAAGEV